MVICITGTRKGIGYDLANTFLEDGHTVIGCSRKDSKIKHDNYQHFCLDVRDRKQVSSMFKSVRKSFGYLDVLINNAAVAALNPFLLTPDDTIDDVFSINVNGLMVVTREATRLLSKSGQKTSSIINISTVAVPLAIPGHSIYSASKAAIEQLTCVLSKELIEINVRVNNLVLPMYRSSMTRTLDPKIKKIMVDSQTIKKKFSLSDLVGPINFLASEQSGFVTGETIALGGVR